MGFTRRGSMIIQYRSSATDEWRRVTKLERFHDDRDAWGVIRIFAGSDIGYTLFEDDDGRTEVHRFDYSTGELGETVYAHDTRDVDSLLFHDGELVGAGYVDDAPATHWFDPVLGGQHARLKAALAGGEVSFVSMSDDGRKILVRHGGANDPGALYVFSPGEGKLDLYGNYRPGIDHRALSEPKPIAFTARDGTKLTGYLTLPRGREARNLPLILYPHGGPYGLRDAMIYDDWLQLLAARGYAVLQVNYRGSGGAGRAFEELGYGQIGMAMQDDLDDAVRWAAGQGTIDAGRVCIVGASYGGYAALWGTIRNPELYRCGVSYAGVTDYQEQMRYDRNYLGRAFYRRYWRERVEGEDWRNLDTISPVKNVSRIVRPIMVAHGRNDRRVPFEQYNVLHRAVVRTDKPVEFHAYDDGHSFANQENEEKFLTAMVTFLEKHNPPYPGESRATTDGNEAQPASGAGGD